ncbi:MAG: O-antigen ligase family protein [Pseudomonadota bacterium]
MPAPAARHQREKKTLIAFLYKHAFWVGLAVGVLLIGEVAPNERLILFEIPLNTLMIVLLMAAALLSGTAVRSLQFFGIPFLLLAVSIVYGLALSQDLDYGLYKAGNLCVISLAILMTFHFYYINNQQNYLWNLVILIMLTYLILAILYKLQYGFWDRQVVFLMNGPIVFARLMGMAALLALLFTKGITRIVLFAVFFLAILWPSSKGPVLALALTLALMMLAYDRLFILGIITVLVATPLLLVPEQIVEIAWLLDGTGRIATPLESFVLGSELSEAHSATFSTRASAYEKTLPLILQYPAGLGLGDWESHTGTGIEYPHNFFLEVFSELGMFFGPLFMIPYLWPLIRPRNKLLWIAVFFAINQQVSGDLLDSRYWLIFGLLSYVPTEKRELDLFRTFFPRFRSAQPAMALRSEDRWSPVSDRDSQSDRIS